MGNSTHKKPYAGAAGERDKIFSTASSLGSWIGYAMELHKALHSSSPGSNRKDAPSRLVEWIDA
ncbi:hypothetical protein PIB30_113141, partial [Stylosanthes scabra]|nr:hypothetical protein [Stylosanthes scabra]